MLDNILAFFTTLISLLTPFSSITPTPAPLPNFPGNTIELGSYRGYLSAVEENEIKLIPNYAQKLSSTSLIKDNNCNLGINGGFYDTNNNPLGLLIVNGEQLSEDKKSSLFNGYVWSDHTALQLSLSKPPGFRGVDFAFQTGPYLQKDLPGKFDNTKHARRMLLAKSADETIYSVAIVGKENDFDGPTLDELHQILFKNLDKYNFVSAINLDGGSASVFYLDGFSLSEYSPIGALICIK